MQDSDLLRLSADIVSAHVAHNAVSLDALPDLIRSVYAALGNAGAPNEVLAQTPAVPIKKSIFPAYLVCLEDGKQLKVLKRHLQTSYGMTPGDYRAKWGLPASYPMVAPDYAARRSALAKELGLGRASSASFPHERGGITESGIYGVPVQKIPAKNRGPKPGSKNMRPIDKDSAAE